MFPFDLFSGFLREKNQEKLAKKKIGSLVLFYGCRYENRDCLLQDELKEYEKNGLLTKLYFSFSREDKNAKIKHVQVSAVKFSLQ